MDVDRLMTMEWLETDGLGGFSSGTAAGVRTRRYHALLLAATSPPTGRMVLVNGCEAWVEHAGRRCALSSQSYHPGLLHPDGVQRLVSFTHEPWPCWRYRVDDGVEVEHDLFVTHGRPVAVLAWRLVHPANDVVLCVRPLLSGREYHALHRENPIFRFEPAYQPSGVVWRPYPGVPGVLSLANGDYRHDPLWYRNFLYREERARGLDDVEDLASPGVLRWTLSAGEAVWVLTTERAGQSLLRSRLALEPSVKAWRSAEHRRRHRFPSPLHRAADAYVVQTDRRPPTRDPAAAPARTIIAGYPWFTDWGRDTFIAMRGLCLATGRLDVAGAVLLAWAETVSEGMLPNRFPDAGGEPEYNAVDASLWYVAAVHEYLAAAARSNARTKPADRRRLLEAVQAILTGYARGTRYGIHLDADGLLAAGRPGVQLTWMDAKVGDWVVTPRIGKPVEVQALWLNALWIASRVSPEWTRVYERGATAFGQRFWNPDGGSLYDVVDVDHVPGKVDARCRPNQIFAVGGLPRQLLTGPRARRIVDLVEARLWTPMGLRSLAPGEPGYAPRYEGGVRERDGAYHQGTVWPWLAGPFVEAWVRVRRSRREVVEQARTRYVQPLLDHLQAAGLGHVSELADAEAPFTPRGCPFQAWSLGEVLRLLHGVLAAPGATRGHGREQRGRR
ncbi:amylo-alpha-1,6-glucosidase [Candidatus Nitrospira bockiana]